MIRSDSPFVGRLATDGPLLLEAFEAFEAFEAGRAAVHAAFAGYQLSVP